MREMCVLQDIGLSEGGGMVEMCVLQDLSAYGSPDATLLMLVVALVFSISVHMLADATVACCSQTSCFA